MAPADDICKSLTRNEDGGLFEIIIRGSVGLFEIIIRGSVGPEDDNLKLPDIRVSRDTLGKSKEDLKFTRLLMFCSTSQEYRQMSVSMMVYL